MSATVADLIVIICSFAIAALLNSETDTINFKPKSAFFKHPFWTERNYMRRKYPRLDWWFKYPLSFLGDGWHLTKSSMIAALLNVPVYLFCRLYGLGGEYYVTGIVLCYVLYGVVFNYGYDY